MSDNSSPQLPLRMSLPPSPNPNSFAHLAGQSYVTPFQSPLPNFTVSDDAQRSLPPLGPFPVGFEPRPIDSLPISTSPGPHQSTQMGGFASNRPEEDVSGLIAGLDVNKLPDRDQTIYANSQAIVSLQAQARRNEETIRKNDETIKDLSQLLVFAKDFTRMKLHYSQEFLQIRNSVDTVNNSIKNIVQSHPEPPHLSHIYFSGNIRETYRFCATMRDTFAQFPNSFSSERQKILWIASYFRAASGNLGEDCPSYNWWCGLLKENADKQGLPVLRASALNDFVISELESSETFLQALEFLFSNHKEVEEARAKLSALRQGSKSITDYNIEFNSYLHLVDFSESTLVALYQDSVNIKIHECGLFRGDWSSIQTLKEKQLRAVALAPDAGEVAALNHRKSAPPAPRIEYRVAVPPVAPPVKTNQQNQQVPMDIDIMTAEAGFNFPLWRVEATRRGICIRCAGNFDEEHYKKRGCPLPEDEWLKKDDLLPIWKSWGGSLREDRNRSDPTRSRYADKGKKRESVSEITDQPIPKKRTSLASHQPDVAPSIAMTQEPGAEYGGICYVDSISNETLTVAELLFNRELSKEEHDE